MALATLLPAVLSAAAGPMPISPGSTTDVPTVDTSCPTFSWTTAAGSAGSELAFWPVDEAGEIAGPQRRIEIQGDARSWTPWGESCLAAGETYAWRVRGEGESPSEPLVFRVAGGPWLDELLEELIFEMVDERRGVEWRAAAAVPTTSSRAAAEAPPRLGSYGHTGSSAGIHADNGDFYGLWASGEAQGIFASASKLEGRAVYGIVTGGSGSVAGVTGITDSTVGSGVYGFGETHGVQGISHQPTGIGVQGLQSGIYVEKFGSGCGVEAFTNAVEGRALTGLATATTGTNYGIYGVSTTESGFDFFAAGTGSYAPFTGSHEVRLGEDAGDIRPGMVVSVTGRAEIRRRPSGTICLSSTLPSVELSRRASDPAVLGVYVAEMQRPADHWSEDASGRFGIVNALGEGRVWVTDVNGAVAIGDYLTTSQIPGFAQRQGDGVRRAHTLGKVTEEIDWEATTETIVHEGRSYRAALIAVVYTSG